MIKTLDISGVPGLSGKEAGERLEKEGFNELPSARERSILSIAADVAKEPMFMLLIAGGVIYLFLGDLQEALMLLGFVFIVMGITLYQERKTERALEALRDMSSPRAVVIRDGGQKRIPGREVVRGDYIIISEGGRVPADAALVSCVNLFVDESLLTGESVPVRKSASSGDAAMARPGGEGTPFVFSGTLAVQGFGVARVLATGARTEIGRIGKALKTIETEETLLQKETGRLVRRLAALGLMVCAAIVIVYGVTRHDWLDGFLAGVALAMAVLPEEIPVILTVFLALGAWRISKRRILTRRVPAVEILGSTTVLCVDKTGTLTLNRMTLTKAFTPRTAASYDFGSSGPVPEEFHELLEFSILASQIDPFDPMEKALRELGGLSLSGTEHIHDNWTLVQEYPLSGELLATSRVWRSPDSADYAIGAKGAPEAIADICHLDEGEIKSLSAQVDAMARGGLRVIGVAKSRFKKTKELPVGQHDFKFEFLGLLGLSDPVRPGVQEAVKECYGAGIRVVMITGDYPVTARNIAARIGLKARDGVITGPELDTMSDAGLLERIRTASIFARVAPEQKLRIVNALKANGEIVAMTGDGVNDAAALKAANIGIAMGGRGTDVAREASAIVLLDDDFGSIVQAVRMGRRIFDNLKKAMAYTMAIHIPIAGISLMPVLLNLPLVLMPVHIVFLELIIDPACSLVFEAEPEEPDVMERQPRNLKEPLFNRKVVTFSVLQGLIVFVIALAVYIITIMRGEGGEAARTLSFTTLIIANLGLILTNRSWSHTILYMLRLGNAALWWVLGGAVSFLAAVLYVPYLSRLFRLTALGPADLLICLGAGLVSILWFEGYKFLNRRKDLLY